MIRGILELSSRRTCGRFQSSIIRQAPLYLSSRKEFSTTSQQKAPSKPGIPGQPPETGGSSSKIVIAGLAIAAGACTAAYLHGFFGQAKVDVDGKEQQDFYNNAKSFPPLREEKDSLIDEVPKGLNKEVDTAQETPQPESLGDTTQKETPQFESLGENKNEVTHHAGDKPAVTLEERKVLNQVTEPSTTDLTPTNDQNRDSGVSPERSHDMESPMASSDMKAEEEVQNSQSSSDDTSITDNVATSVPREHLAAVDRQEDSLANGEGAPSSLLEAYHLRDGISHSPVSMNSHDEIEAFASSIEDLNDGAVIKDGKLILDFLQAIHAAEKRQAELDARIFAEEKRAMKEKYEKELKDAIARQLMHAEEAALLDKELKRERAKAVAALKSLQVRLEEKYKTELEQKENESELKLKKVEELAKAEMVAAIAREKASQIEKMAEADLHINALCMAFYARSEEARRSHSVHKLALGALALEDALTKGLPIKAEIDALQAYLEGLDKGSMLDLVISSLPEETITHGSDTVLQLNQQFDVLRDTLRHYSLIPPGGGGILAHSLAHVASLLKVKEVDQSGDGIESVISRVDGFLKEGRLAEAADALEEGVQGSQAAEIVGSWVRQARNRAIAEQALMLLQSYAAAVSLT